MSERPLDLICLGRAAVDLYAEQIGSPLEDAQSFAKYVGGCAANIAVGAARQGLRVAMLSKVGDEQMGRFVRRTLAAEGVDVSRLGTDPRRLTGLVLLGLLDRETFPLIFYRTDCADMALAPEDFDADFIGGARALLVTGTHFSTPAVDRASRQAMAWARERGTRVVLDVDYRPVLWGLTGPALGEERFVASDRVSQHLQSIVPGCDLVVGTEEEIHVAGGSTDTVAALSELRRRTAATIVLKRGPLGCVVFEGAIPDRVEDGLVARGRPVEVLNVLGAGDAFLSGLLRGWLEGEPWERACAYANACGAIVVSRHGCAPAMPTRRETDDFLERGRLDARLEALHRPTIRRRRDLEIRALAFDHRRQLEELCAKEKAEPARLHRLKALIAEAAAQVADGVLCDDKWGGEALLALARTPLWVARPVELPGSRPLAFEAGPEVSATIRRWPAAHVVKCLVFYHPDDDEPMRRAQDAALRQLMAACRTLERELLLEVILPKGLPADDLTLARSLERIYALDVRPDWWKLPPPATEAGWRAIEETIDAADPDCRGILLLGLDAPEEELAKGFRLAAGRRWCRGFAVGRTIFGAPAADWLGGRIDDAALVERVAAAYRRVASAWRSR